MSPALPREERDAIKPRVAVHPTLRDREWLRYVEAIEDALDAAEEEVAVWKGQVAGWQRSWNAAVETGRELMAERDAARAEVAALRGRIEAATGLPLTDDDMQSIGETTVDFGSLMEHAYGLAMSRVRTALAADEGEARTVNAQPRKPSTDDQEADDE